LSILRGHIRDGRTLSPDPRGGLMDQRVILQMQCDWFARRINESDPNWTQRIILQANLVELARVIVILKNTRKARLKLWDGMSWEMLLTKGACR